MMAKLYWRVKMNGKWTWRPACLNMIHTEGHVIDCNCVQEEEE